MAKKSSSQPTLRNSEHVLFHNQYHVLRHTRNGLILNNLNSAHIGDCLEHYGEYSYYEQQLFEQLIKPKMVVLDVGANMGIHTVTIAKIMQNTGRIYAFEPQRLIFQELCANLALNNITNVYSYQRALGKTSGTIKVPQLNLAVRQNFGALSLGDLEQGDEVEMVTIDSLNLPACHFIKMDIEGMEIDALCGAKATFTKFRPILYIENNQPGKQKALIQQINAMNYDCYWHNPLVYHPDNFYGNPRNVFHEGLVSYMMLCVHRDSDISINAETIKI